MRDFKFRAWDSLANKMLNHSFLAQYPLEQLIEAYEEDEDSVLLQYTGMKDRNNKEVYEGDIVKIKLHAYGGIQGDSYNWESGVIKWDNQKAGFYWFDESNIGWKLEENEMEVIGNIYQNPELMSL